jgi:hypothetical protein
MSKQLVLRSGVIGITKSDHVVHKNLELVCQWKLDIFKGAGYRDQRILKAELNELFWRKLRRPEC